MLRRTLIITLVSGFLLTSLYLNQESLHAEKDLEPKDSSVFSTLAIESPYQISFEYPKNWHIKTMRGGDRTPFGILITEADTEKQHQAPGLTYPDKYINIVFIKTSKSGPEYVAEEFTFKKMPFENIHFSSEDEDIIKYTGNSKLGKYNASYIDSENFIVKIETYIKNGSDVDELEKIFEEVTKSVIVPNTSDFINIPANTNE